MRNNHDKMKKKYNASQFAFLITSVGEPYLHKCINSILNQKFFPGQIILSIPNKTKIKSLSKKILVIRSKSKNQVHQRIIAKKYIKKKIKIIVQLDCKYLLGKNCLEDLIKLWSKQNHDVAGIGLIPSNYILPKINILQKILLSNSSYPGRVLKSGYVSAWNNKSRITNVEWLNGGSVSWRFDLCQDIFKRRYPLISWSVAEDLIYSFNKNKKYKLLVTKNIKLKFIKLVKENNFEILKNFKRGYFHSKIVKNFVINNSDLSIFLFYYTTFFTSVFGIFFSFFTFKPNKFFLYCGRFFGGIVRTYNYKIK